MVRLKKILRIAFVIYGVFVLSVPIGCTQYRNTKYAEFLSELENEVVSELNLARQNPRKYASFLEQMKPYYDGKLIKRPGKPIIQTEEGIRAVDEAIRFLNSAAPLPPFKISAGLSRAARDHVKDQGPKGKIGHNGSDGSQAATRVNRYGKWKRTLGENIAYGGEDARNMVMGLIIDDGVPNRGHRKNIFNPAFRIIGVACGQHSVFKTMGVITFAGDYIEERKK